MYFIKFALLLTICCSFQNYLTDAQFWDSAIDVQNQENSDEAELIESPDTKTNKDELTSGNPGFTDLLGSTTKLNEFTSSTPGFTDSQGSTTKLNEFTSSTPGFTDSQGTTTKLNEFTSSTPGFTDSKSSLTQRVDSTTNILPQTTDAPKNQLSFSVTFSFNKTANNESVLDVQNQLRTVLTDGIKQLWNANGVSKVIVTFSSSNYMSFIASILNMAEPVETISLNANVTVEINQDKMPQNRTSYNSMLQGLNSGLAEFFSASNIPGIQYEKDRFTMPEYNGDDNDNGDKGGSGGLSLLWLWIVLGVVGGLVVIAIVTIIIIQRRKRRNTRVSPMGYESVESIHMTHSGRKKY